MGREVLLRGYIDRVDLAELTDAALGIVIDYKRTRNKSLDLSRVYHGVSLQLLGYLLVLAEHGQTLAGRPVEPVGAFYLSLVDTYESVSHPREVEDGSRIGTRRLMPRGLLNADRFDALDGHYTGRGRSEYYNLSRGTKDGALNYIDTSDAADGEIFGALLDHTRVRMGELADGIVDGDVSVNPYRLKGFSPCSWCSFNAVCRFEFGVNLPRYLSSLSRSTVFDRVTGAAPGD
jgi:ATP-dependent helicase/nuclease subunit B